MFVKIPHQVFELGLRPNELKLYLYATSFCCNCMGVATVRIATLQKQCAIDSAVTVRTALHGLEKKGLLSLRRRQSASGDYISNEYSFKRMNGAWFPLDMKRKPFLLEKTSFAVYLYILKKSRGNRSAWPSYSMIAATLGIARKTAITAIAHLVDLGALAKSALRAGKHNLYKVLNGSASAFTHKSEARSLSMSDYEILGVKPTATPDEIKKAYREAVKALHPDVNPAPNAEALFRMSREAYERILSGQPRLDEPPRTSETHSAPQPVPPRTPRTFKQNLAYAMWTGLSKLTSLLHWLVSLAAAVAILPTGAYSIFILWALYTTWKADVISQYLTLDYLMHGEEWLILWKLLGGTALAMMVSKLTEMLDNRVGEQAFRLSYTYLWREYYRYEYNIQRYGNL